MSESPIDAELAKRIELAKREWETTVDTISEGLSLFDTSTLSIRRVNWPFARLFQTTPKKMVGANIHHTLCGCVRSDCPIRKILKSTHTSKLDVRSAEYHRFWSLCVYPISEISGSRPHLQHNVVVLRDITEERHLQNRIVEAEKQAYVVELVDHLIGRVNPCIDEVRDLLAVISGHWIALREVLRRTQETTPDDYGTYTELAFREIEQAIRKSLENLDHVNRVVGCLDKLEISTGHVARGEVGTEAPPISEWSKK